MDFLIWLSITIKTKLASTDNRNTLFLSQILLQRNPIWRLFKKNMFSKKHFFSFFCMTVRLVRNERVVTRTLHYLWVHFLKFNFLKGTIGFRAPLQVFCPPFISFYKHEWEIICVSISRYSRSKYIWYLIYTVCI